VKPVEIVTVVLSTVAVIVLPLFGLLWRFSSKWTAYTYQLQHLGEKIQALVTDKERTHVILQDQITHDREATDKRLRWLETNLWRRLGTERKDAA
jgi:hypothetical protein